MALSIRAAADHLGLSETEVKAEIKAGTLTLNNQDLIDQNEIVRFQAAQRDAEAEAYLFKRDASIQAEVAASYALRNIRNEVDAIFAGKIQAEVKKRYTAYLMECQPHLVQLAERFSNDKA